jgi:hypothetical protein
LQTCSQFTLHFPPKTFSQAAQIKIGPFNAINLQENFYCHFNHNDEQIQCL